MQTYFTQHTKEELITQRHELIKFLVHSKKCNYDVVCGIIEAYDYFINNPNYYDGATLVPDLYDWKTIEIGALIHDYIYLDFNIKSNWKYKNLADKLYKRTLIYFDAENNLRKTKLIANERKLGLLISTPFLWIFNKLKNGKMTDTQKHNFIKYYNKFNSL